MVELLVNLRLWSWRFVYLCSLVKGVVVSGDQTLPRWIQTHLCCRPEELAGLLPLELEIPWVVDPFQWVTLSQKCSERRGKPVFGTIVLQARPTSALNLTSLLHRWLKNKICRWVTLRLCRGLPFLRKLFSREK